MRAALLLTLLTAVPVAAQDHAMHDGRSPAEDSVVAVAKRLFDGMRAHDAAMIAATFAEGAMMTGVPRPGQPVAFEPVSGFVAQAGTPGEPWDEQIYDPEVRIDGGLATLYVFYTFSLGEQFSHCGVDTFWMVRTAEGWKIAALADTRRREGCETTGRQRVE
jgi:hypothetical protein